jgi:histidinol dehydrogenase
VGDYLAGPSHVLPTAGTARFASPLSVATFRRRMSVLELSARSLAALAPAVEVLAKAEGLEAHWRAVEVRVAKEPARRRPSPAPAARAGRTQPGRGRTARGERARAKRGAPRRARR